MLATCPIPLHTYFEPSWWKLGDVVAIKIEEHQLLGPRERLGMDGLDCITLQTDALNLWNCSQSVALQVCDAILSFTQQDYITYHPDPDGKSHSLIWEQHTHLIWWSRHQGAGWRGRHGALFYDSRPLLWLKQTWWSIYRRQDSRTQPAPSTVWWPSAISGTSCLLGSAGCSETASQ